jgi:DNA-binding transcriptional regulator YiaG
VSGHTDIRDLREKVGLGRERVVRELEPPVTAKTLERWEKGSTPIPGWRDSQLRALYARYLNGVPA